MECTRDLLHTFFNYMCATLPLHAQDLIENYHALQTDTKTSNPISSVRTMLETKYCQGHLILLGQDYLRIQGLVNDFTLHFLVTKGVDETFHFTTPVTTICC